MVRRKKESGLDLFLAAPWWFSAVVAVGVFIAFLWIIPVTTASNPILNTFGQSFKPFGYIVGAFFGLIALVNFFRQKDFSALFRSAPNRANKTPDRLPPKWGPPSLPSTTATSKSSVKTPPTEWSLQLLRRLEWKRFELLCAEYFRELGKRVETINHGVDGGLDARVYANDSTVMEFAIQCKAWDGMVGVKPIRELFGVMAHESAGKGIFIATSVFTDEGKQFAAKHKDKLFLIDGEKFVSMLLKLPEDKQMKLLAFATEGDYTTHTCASCGIKMVRRKGKNGKFWGCQSYPKCRFTLGIASV
jgi:restriction system protein